MPLATRMKGELDQRPAHVKPSAQALGASVKSCPGPVQGEDFKGKPAGVQARIRPKAKAMGYSNGAGKKRPITVRPEPKLQ